MVNLNQGTSWGIRGRVNAIEGIMLRRSKEVTHHCLAELTQVPVLSQRLVFRGTFDVVDHQDLHWPFRRFQLQTHLLLKRRC